MAQDVRTQFQKLLADHPGDFRIYSEGDAINSENLDGLEKPIDNTDPRLIDRIQSALAAGRQVAVVAASPTSLLLMISKEATRLFDGPPGTKMSPYKMLVTQGHASLIEGTQAKLNGNHEKGKALYRSALQSFREAEKLRPNEASPKLGIAEASSHLWDTEDPAAVYRLVEAAEHLLDSGQSEDKINKFGGKDTVHYEYALCNLAMRKRDAAKENLRKVLAVNPDHRYAGGILKKIEEEDAKKGGCFIASAAFGSPLAPEVEYLRAFRDDVLIRSDHGRAFVQAYYRWSPPVAALIANSRWAKAATRVALILPMIVVIKTLRGDRGK